MYDYRKMITEEREKIVEIRKKRSYPWHRPPHIQSSEKYRIITASCFEHKIILDTSKRLLWFENELLERLKNMEISCAAWCILPNHYHILVSIEDFKLFSSNLGKFHGRTSYIMNKEDKTRGRKVWFRFQDRCMRSEEHFNTTLNYIHNNPVKHGLVDKWQEWPFSSVNWYLLTKGRDWLLDLWRQYPLKNYGKKWDP